MCVIPHVNSLVQDNTQDHQDNRHLCQKLNDLPELVNVESENVTVNFGKVKSKVVNSLSINLFMVDCDVNSDLDNTQSLQLDKCEQLLFDGNYNPTMGVDIKYSQNVSVLELPLVNVLETSAHSVKSVNDKCDLRMVLGNIDLNENDWCDLMRKTTCCCLCGCLLLDHLENSPSAIANVLLDIKTLPVVVEGVCHLLSCPILGVGRIGSGLGCLPLALSTGWHVVCSSVYHSVVAQESCQCPSKHTSLAGNLVVNID
jgi:hypothetical protein